MIAFTGIDQAQATTTIREFIRGMAMAETTLDVRGTESNLEQYGIYFDDLARIEGLWKFTHRLFVPIYVGRDCVTGDLLTSRSALLRTE